MSKIEGTLRLQPLVELDLSFDDTLHKTQLTLNHKIRLCWGKCLIPTVNTLIYHIFPTETCPTLPKGQKLKSKMETVPCTISTQRKLESSALLLSLWLILVKRITVQFGWQTLVCLWSLLKSGYRTFEYWYITFSHVFFPCGKLLCVLINL